MAKQRKLDNSAQFRACRFPEGEVKNAVGKCVGQPEKLPAMWPASRSTRHFPARESVHFFCARPRTIDVGAREMPRSVVTAGPLCNEGQFAEKIARFANLEFDVSS
jgi:hypothetical protein